MKRVLVPGLFGIAAYFAVFGGEYSIFEVRDARAELAAETVRLEQLQQRNAALTARADSVEHDPATIERIAREEYGMIRPGEVLYVFAQESND